MNCRRCGTHVTPGLRLCERCALEYGDGPKFSMEIAPQPRPPYEPTAPPPQEDTDAR